MSKQRTQRELSAQGGLQNVVEPLASYICAADHPRVALASALKALIREVQLTNQTALAHFGALAKSL